MTRLLLTLPMPPSANRYWRHGIVGKGRNARPVTYLSDEAKAYREEVALRTREITPFPACVAYSMSVFVIRWTRDLGNCEKVLMDALRGIVFIDDNLIVESHALKFPNDHDPRVELEFWEVDDPRKKKP